MILILDQISIKQNIHCMFYNLKNIKTMFFIYTRYRLISLIDRRKNLFSQTKDFRVKNILGGVLIHLMKLAFGIYLAGNIFMGTDFIVIKKFCLNV